MSEQHDSDVSVNGTGTTVAPGAKRRKIANTSIDGSVASITFRPDTPDSVTRSYDIHRLPGGEKLDGMLASVVAYGVVAVLQSAYSGEDDPVAAADEQWNRLVSGHWAPGRMFTAGGSSKLSDPLALAISEYLTSRGKPPLSPEDFNEVFVPAYMEKTGIKSVAAAKRALGMHPEVAAIRSKVMAERAKSAAAAAKRTNAPALMIDI